MKVYTIFITDASGSMSHLAGDVRGGHNTYLDEVAKKADPQRGVEVYVTTATFNTKVTIIDNAVPVAQATRFDQDNYLPHDGTALLDAVGQTLRAFNAETTLEDGDKVFVYVTTDGHENSSREYTKEAVAAIIAEMEAKEVAFVFSGTGPGDWSEQGRGMGMAASTSNAASGIAVASAYAGRAAAVVDYMEAEVGQRSTFTSANVSGLIQDTIDKAGEGA